MDKVRYAAELSVIDAVYRLGKYKTNSKMSGMLKKLQKETTAQYIKAVSKLNNAEFRKAVSIVHQWIVDTGWDKEYGKGKQKNLGTLISFSAKIIEDSPNKHNPKINKIIVDIVDYMNKGNKFYTASMPAGELAAEKWQKLFN